MNKKTMDFIEAIRERGYKETMSESLMWRTFEKIGEPRRFFISKVGRIRVGSDLGNSNSATAVYRRRYLGSEVENG